MSLAAISYSHSHSVKMDAIQGEVLIVDSDLETLPALSKELRDRGYKVRGVTSGEMAFASVRAERPDIILMAVSLPDRTGYEICCQFKADVRTKSIPILLMGDLDEPIDKAKVFQVGGADYLSKPFCIEEVRARVEHQISLLRARASVDRLNARLDLDLELDRRVEQRTAELELVNQLLEKEIEERQAIEQSLRASEEQFRQFAEHIHEVFWLLDWPADRAPECVRVVYVSPAYETIWQRSCAELYANPWHWLADIHPEERDRVERAFMAEAMKGNFDEEYRIVRPDGSIRWIHDRGFSIPDRSGKTYRIAGIAEDITERKQVEERLLYEALHDTLTGLASRGFFMERVDLALQKFQGDPSRYFAVLFVDLDRFKLINDSLGHHIGDLLLIEVSNILRNCLENHLQKSSTVARLGGDEFTLLLENMQNLEEVIEIANRIQKMLQKSFTLDGCDVFTSASIGIVLSAPGHKNASDVLRDADVAMYRAKQKGKNRYEIFDRFSSPRPIERSRLLSRSCYVTPSC